MTTTQQIVVVTAVGDFIVTFEGTAALAIQNPAGGVQWRFGQPKDDADLSLIAQAIEIREWLKSAVQTKKIVRLRRVDAYQFEHNTDGKGWSPVLGYVHVFRQDMARMGMHLIEEACA